MSLVTTSGQAVLGGGRVAVQPNVSAEYFAKECQVYRGLWLRLAFANELPSPGDYVVKKIEMFGLSVLITRGRDDKIRAFHNICRHRGNRLVNAAVGQGRALTCAFHSWCYNLEGKLISVLDEADFPPFDKASRDLLPVHLGVWNGLVFVNLAKAPAESLDDFLAPLLPRLGTVDLGALRNAGSYSATVNANWKTVQDAFIEAYHVRTVHARSLPNLRRQWIPREIGILGRHTTMTAFQNLGGDAKPTEAFVWRTAAGFMKPDEAAPLPAGLNPQRRPNWVFDQFSIFPNQLIIVGHGWFTHHEFWPVTVDQCLWSASYFVPPTDSPLQQVANEFYKVRVRDTVLEDLECIEAVHASHRTGMLPDMLVCGQEAQILRHRQVLQEYVDALPESDP